MKKLLFLMLPLLVIGTLHSDDEVYIETSEEPIKTPDDVTSAEANRTLAARSSNKKENRTIRREHNPTMNYHSATTEQRQSYLKGPTYQANPGGGNNYYYSQPQPQTVNNPNQYPLYPNQSR